MANNTFEWLIVIVPSIYCLFATIYWQAFIRENGRKIVKYLSKDESLQGAVWPAVALTSSYEL